MVNYEFTSEVIMSDEAGSWIPYCVSVSPQIKHYVGNSASLNSQGRKLIMITNYGSILSLFYAFAFLALEKKTK